MKATKALFKIYRRIPFLFYRPDRLCIFALDQISFCLGLIFLPVGAILLNVFCISYLKRSVLNALRLKDRSHLLVSF